MLKVLTFPHPFNLLIFKIKSLSAKIFWFSGTGPFNIDIKSLYRNSLRLPNPESFRGPKDAFLEGT
jgi:hypothetical protein